MMLSRILFQLFPQRCIFCGNICKDYLTSPSCLKCFNSLESWGESCMKCGKKIPSSGICGECLKSQTPFDFLFHLYSYEGNAKILINLYKFKGAWYLAEPFAIKIYEVLKKIPGDFNGAPLTFVPHHPYRVFTRNYHPVELLTRTVCKKFKIKLVPTLRKNAFKKPQTSLKKKEREKNVKGTFKIIEKNLPENLIIFDDIYTTGSTLGECAKTLKKAGVVKLAGITLARA